MYTCSSSCRPVCLFQLPWGFWFLQQVNHSRAQMLKQGAEQQLWGAESFTLGRKSRWALMLLSSATSICSTGGIPWHSQASRKIKSLQCVVVLPRGLHDASWTNALLDRNKDECNISELHRISMVLAEVVVSIGTTFSFFLTVHDERGSAVCLFHQVHVYPLPNVFWWLPTVQSNYRWHLNDWLECSTAQYAIAGHPLLRSRKCCIFFSHFIVDLSKQPWEIVVCLICRFAILNAVGVSHDN